MPTSDLSLWPYIVERIVEVEPRRVLDVGPGYGKAGVLLREYVPTIVRLDAVEAEGSYITDRLQCLYDSVIWGDVCRLPNAVLESYDLVLLADVIEHIDKDAGRDLLGRIPGFIVISTPAHFFQNPPTYESEVHRSLWTVEDFSDRLDVHVCEREDAHVVRLRPR